MQAPGGVRIGVPRDYAAIRSTDSSLAEAWRDATGEIMAQCFALGLRVVAFDADLQGGYPAYALGAARDLDRLARGRGVTRVRAVELRMIGLPLVRPFRTSFGTSTEKVCVLARVETDDAEGWGSASPTSSRASARSSTRARGS